MYSIIVVDDEADVRGAIIDIIEWDKLGFRLAGEAGNGQEALELIEDTSPDVIITDIRMPFMDGISLAQRIRETNPVTKIVFLTGFNDFDYAVSAIKLNVIAYLVKPISAKDLTETLISLKEKLDGEQQGISDTEHLREMYKRSMEMHKTSYLVSMVTEEAFVGINYQAQRQSPDEYGLRLTGERFLLFAVSPDISSFPDATVPTDNYELLKFSVVKTVRGIAEKYVGGEIFAVGSNVVGILSDSKENIEAYADILIKEIHQSIPRFYGFCVTIGVSAPYDDISHTKEAYREALSAINYRVVLGNGKVIYLSDVEKEGAFVPVFSDARDMQLCSIIKTGTKDEMLCFVGEIFSELASHKAGIEFYRISVIEMYAAVLRSLKSVSNSIEAEISGSLGLDEKLFSYDPVELKKWFTGLCDRVMENISTQRKTTVSILAGEGHEYIKNNYADPEISLKSVSRHFNISASYFSSLFRKEIGLPFKDALIKVRMEAAKELILTTSLRVFEVADQCGYSDQHYFSYCFKKYFGQSPGEMRASHISRTSGETPADGE
ncbi:MAG TPA: hypothetical protein DEQ02_05390 [Ruminococcaceae bacterium]|nr:hypothetical protein [Oscillospiraceae bacterium]